MIRNVSRRLNWLEARAREITAITPEPHTIVFRDVDMSVSGTMHWDSGKLVWTESTGEDRRFRAQLKPE